MHDSPAMNAPIAPGIPEVLPGFVRIGNQFINMNRVAIIHLGFPDEEEASVQIEFSPAGAVHDPLTLRGEQARSFLDQMAVAEGGIVIVAPSTVATFLELIKAIEAHALGIGLTRYTAPELGVRLPGTLCLRWQGDGPSADPRSVEANVHADGSIIAVRFDYGPDGSRQYENIDPATAEAIVTGIAEVTSP